MRIIVWALVAIVVASVVLPAIVRFKPLGILVVLLLLAVVALRARPKKGEKEKPEEKKDAGAAA